MDAKKRAALQEAGYVVTTTSEFLGLSDYEVRVVELRVALSRAVRSRRTKAGLTQEGLADIAGTSQSRVARVEAGGQGITLDLQFRCLFAVGGGLADVAGEASAVRDHPERGKPRPRDASDRAGDAAGDRAGDAASDKAGDAASDKAGDAASDKADRARPTRDKVR
jgi:transcriptional regulator with XRE-family HTH domain